MSSTQIVGINEVSVELVIAPVQGSDSGTYHCKAEPKAFQHQTIKPYVLKESFVKLNVARKRSRNVGIQTAPLSFYSVITLCIILFVL